jgi:hypothetical protein
VGGDLRGGRVLATGQQRLAQVLGVDVLPDEHHLALARLVAREGPLAGAEVDLLVHALEHELGVALVSEGQHALGAVEVGGLGLQEGAHEGVEQRDVQQAGDGEAHRGDERQVVHLLDALLLRGGRVVVAVLV